MQKWLQRIWYEGSPLYRVMLPLSWLYWLIITLRRALYRAGLLRSHEVAVPVVVVGNITAGGTGKTPVTIWLVRELRQRGFTPGVVSRGYGGSKSGSAMRVDTASDPAVVGDEPVLIARRTGCPVIVDANRARAAQLLAAQGVDVIVADDGLQHYRLARTFEICVIDGARGLGNRRLIPAGPLRESVDRLCEVDQVLVNGSLPRDAGDMTAVEQNAIEFRLVAREVSRIDGSLTRPIERFAGTTVHAVAAIGNPRRFFALLRGHGIDVIEHAYRDHARLARRDLEFGDDVDVLMTEKDAVKLDKAVGGRFWFVPVEFDIDPVISGAWLQQVESRLRKDLERP